MTKGMYKQCGIPLRSSMSHSCQPEMYRIHQALTRLPACNCCVLASPNVLRLPCTQLPLSCDTKSVPSIASYNQVHCHCHCAFVMRSAIVQRLWLYETNSRNHFQPFAHYVTVVPRRDSEGTLTKTIAETQENIAALKGQCRILYKKILKL